MVPPKFAQAARQSSEDLEGTIGKLWLNRIGIVAILIGVAYFLKYAFDSGWIGPGGRVAIGLLAGIAVVVWSEAFRRKGSVAFSYSLKAVGIGILYLSLWAASQYFHLIPAGVAFAAMILVTASTITLALTQDAEILAVYAMIGGFSTPALVSTGENHEIVLFSYVLLLDVAVLAMVSFKPWRRIVWGAMLGTAVMYIGWAAQYYDLSERMVTVLFASAFFAVFALAPLVTPLTRSRWHRGMSITLMLLPLVNGAAYFLALFAVYETETVTLTWYALALAAVYLLLSSQFKRRVGSEPEVVKTINLIHVAVAIAFITIAIPLKLDAHWITIGWLIESGVLLFVGVKSEAHFLRIFAGCTLTLGVFRLLFFDNFHTETLVFNARFATFLVAIAIMAGIVAAGERYGSEREMPFVKLAGIALNLLALIALTREANDYFSRQIVELYHQRNMYGAVRQLEIAKDFSFSAIWIVYGAGLMVAGFWKRSAFIRWQAMVLLAVTIGKVFLYDSRELQQIYRILSFIALGVMLMAISYAYHRDWFKLSPRKSGVEQETSS
ncbi:MAG: rane protein [Candidatus Angelobacter sp.]|nr:rane protein [Candidatus Angelobacter sp.]